VSEPNALKSVRLAMVAIDASAVPPLPVARDNDLSPVIVAAIKAAPTKNPA
jgi:hypothetical protein